MEKPTKLTPYIDQVLEDEYAAKFFAGIPVGPWHSQEVRREAERQARLAIDGKRGRLDPEEFPMAPLPPGADA